MSGNEKALVFLGAMGVGAYFLFFRKPAAGSTAAAAPGVKPVATPWTSNVSSHPFVAAPSDLNDPARMQQLNYDVAGPIDESQAAAAMRSDPNYSVVEGPRLPDGSMEWTRDTFSPYQ